jgi:hypothetical protein
VSVVYGILAALASFGVLRALGADPLGSDEQRLGGAVVAAVAVGLIVGLAV